MVDLFSGKGTVLWGLAENLFHPLFAHIHYARLWNFRKFAKHFRIEFHSLKMALRQV